MNSEDVITKYALLKGNDEILESLSSKKDITDQYVRMITENKQKIEEGDDVKMRNILLQGLRLQIVESNDYIRGLIDYLKQDADEENSEGRTKSLKYLGQLLEEEQKKELY